MVPKKLPRAPGVMTGGESKSAEESLWSRKREQQNKNWPANQTYTQTDVRIRVWVNCSTGCQQRIDTKEKSV
jgi:hypothetical protein